MTSVTEAIQKLFADVRALGISGIEIEEETRSVNETVLGAIVHHDGSVDGVSKPRDRRDLVNNGAVFTKELNVNPIRVSGN